MVSSSSQEYAGSDSLLKDVIDASIWDPQT